MTRTADSRKLEVHVLSAGQGESIVLRLPDDTWGVVDCYSPSLRDPSKNPTLRFLREEQNVSTLGFLCLTHPHEDHYRGMSQLLDELDVLEFWSFGGLSGRHFVDLVQYFHLDARYADRTEGIENASELMRIFQFVRRDEIPHRRIVSRQQLYPPRQDLGAPLQIWSMAPSGNRITKYEEQLAKCFDCEGRGTKSDTYNLDAVIGN